MALDVLAKMAHQFRHAQHQRSVDTFPVAMEFLRTHPGLAFEHHGDFYHRSTSHNFPRFSTRSTCGFLSTESGRPVRGGSGMGARREGNPYNSGPLSGTIT